MLISQLVYDDVVLVASSSTRTVSSRLKIGRHEGISKSESMGLSRKRVACSLPVGGLKVLQCSFMRERKVQWLIDRWISKASSVMWTLYQ